MTNLMAASLRALFVFRPAAQCVRSRALRPWHGAMNTANIEVQQYPSLRARGVSLVNGR